MVADLAAGGGEDAGVARRADTVLLSSGIERAQDGRKAEGGGKAARVEQTSRRRLCCIGRGRVLAYDLNLLNLQPARRDMLSARKLYTAAWHIDACLTYQMGRHRRL